MKMGLGVLGGATTCIKRKFRWMMSIQNVCGDASDAGGKKVTSILPPSKSARPSLSFKEIEAQHLTETIYYPSKPDWKPISLVLYDLVGNTNPVFEWLKNIYDPKNNSKWISYGVNDTTVVSMKRNATLVLVDGCGNVIEEWNYANAWPNTIEWGDLDMASGDVVTVDLTLRYDRAWVS